jgi:hypothetical protein
MSTLTMAFYAAGAGFLAAMLIDPVLRFLRFARCYRLRCPEDAAPAAVWATPAKDAQGREALRLESCTRLGPGQACGKMCLPGLR